jgi:hypothetical protein
MMLPDDAVLQIFNIQIASLRRVNLRLSCTSIQKAWRAYEGEAGCLAVIAYHHMGHQN